MNRSGLDLSVSAVPGIESAHQVVGTLALVGGVLILVSPAIGLLLSIQYFAQFVSVSAILSSPVWLCAGVPLGVLGTLAVWMGVRALRGRSGDGLALFFIGLVALPPVVLSLGWVGIPGTLLLMFAGAFDRATDARETRSSGSA